MGETIMEAEQFKPFLPNPAYLIGNQGTIIGARGKPLSRITHYGKGILPDIEIPIRIDKKIKIFKAIRIIAEVWVAKPENIKTSRLSAIPNDGDIYNLWASNIKWVTRTEKFAFSREAVKNFKAKDKSFFSMLDMEYGGAF